MEEFAGHCDADASMSFVWRDDRGFKSADIRSSFSSVQIIGNGQMYFTAGELLGGHIGYQPRQRRTSATA
jgi:hypothetical protein